MELLKPKNQSSGSSTQQYVDVENIRDGIIILKNGAFRSILLVSSINFDLKSADEQNAVIAQYQSFLNSLDFPVQIIVSSRRFDIRSYIDRLEDEEKQQENELLRFQISEYKNFVKNLTDVSNIMSKYFYVVVPFSPSEDEKGGLGTKLFGIFRPKEAVKDTGHLFETYRAQMLQRVEHVSAVLGGTGVKVSALNTEEIIELLYNSYNPSLFVATILKDMDNVDISSL